MAFNPLVDPRAATFKTPSEGTLAAATPVNVDYDTEGTHAFALAVTNTGDEDMTVTVQKSPTGEVFGTDTQLTTAIGTLASGDTVLVELTDCSFDMLRLVLESTVGTDYSIDIKGVR